MVTSRVATVSLTETLSTSTFTLECSWRHIGLVFFFTNTVLALELIHIANSHLWQDIILILAQIAGQHPLALLGTRPLLLLIIMAVIPLIIQIQIQIVLPTILPTYVHIHISTTVIIIIVVPKPAPLLVLLAHVHIPDKLVPQPLALRQLPRERDPARDREVAHAVRREPAARPGDVAERAREEVPRDRGPPFRRARARPRPRRTRRRVVGGVQGGGREGQVLELVLWRVGRVPGRLVGEEVLVRPPARGGFPSATASHAGRERDGAYLRVSEQGPQLVAATGRIWTRVSGSPRTARPPVFVLLHRAVGSLRVPMSVFPLRPLLPPLFVCLSTIRIRIRIRRAISVAGEGGTAVIPGSIILEDAEAGQVLRENARPDVDHRIVVIMHLAELSEVLKVLVQRVVQLLALVERFKIRGADTRDARLPHDVFDVDPEEMVDVHMPVQVGYNRVLEAEGDLDVPEVAVGEVEPRSWWDVPGEYDLQVVGRGPCSEPHRAGGRTCEGFCFTHLHSPLPKSIQLHL